jgi:hypothetical protein
LPDFSTTLYLLSALIEFLGEPFGPRTTAPEAASKTEPWQGQISLVLLSATAHPLCVHVPSSATNPFLFRVRMTSSDRPDASCPEKTCDCPTLIDEDFASKAPFDEAALARLKSAAAWALDKKNEGTNPPMIARKLRLLILDIARGYLTF